MSGRVVRIISGAQLFLYTQRNVRVQESVFSSKKLQYVSTYMPFSPPLQRVPMYQSFFSLMSLSQ